MELWTAISIGLLGSLHCIGMCGPIALALPLDRSSQFSKLNGTLIYNLGRILTYFLLGSVFGLLGYGFALAGFQQWISIIVGVFMISTVIFSSFTHSKYLQIPGLNSLISSVKSKLGKRFNNNSYPNLLSIGILNGFLPCGLVYLGLAGATASTTIFEGGLFMVAFGLGTLPMMLAVAFYGQQIKVSLMRKGKKLIPVFVILIGSLFILRGMNLGVPYISPKLEQNQTENCH